MKQLFLHLGYPKTGTTTLQKHLFPNHPDIDYLGKKIPDFSYMDNTLKSEISKLINSSSMTYTGHIKLKNLIDEWRCKTKGKILLISTESFLHATASDPEIVSKRLYDTFYPCKVIIVLREQKDILRSFYSMHGRFLQYIFLTREETEKLSLPVGIETWLELCFRTYDRNFLSFLHYDKVLACYIEKLTAENVGIFLYEELKSNPITYFKSISDFMGINSSISSNLLMNKHENEVLSYGELFWWHIAKMFKLKKQDEIFIRRTNSIFHSFLSKMQKKKDIIPFDWQEKINNTYAQSNRRLIELTGLPLYRFHYPI